MILSPRFHVNRTLENATLTLDFDGPGTIGIDRVSFISEDAVLGLWRPDVVTALRDLHPGILRFGGSILEDYEWNQCLGPSDQRAPFPVQCWGGLEENFVGPEEFVALCRKIGAEPLVCLRWTAKTPADAAAEVEYFNRGPDTRWGGLRAKHGHPAPWNVKYWQIGNEVGGRDYDASVRAFAEAMRRVDPTIRILSAFPSGETLQAASGHLDYLCPHHYGCADLPAMEASFAALESWIRRTHTTRPVRLAVTEWNTTAGDWGLGRATLQTLANALACSRYHLLMQRHADAVEIAIRSNLIDSFGSGVIQTGPGSLFCAPTYYAQQLFARAAGSHPLRIAPSTNKPQDPVPWPLAEPDLGALLSADGRMLRIYGVNTTPHPITVKTVLSGFDSGVRQGQALTLEDVQDASTPEVLNSRDEPDRIRVSRQAVRARGRTLDLSFPHFSLTLYELELAPHALP